MNLEGGSAIMGGLGSSSGGGGVGGDVDEILQTVVHKAIREVVYGDGNTASSETNANDDTALPAKSSSMVQIAEPILLPFRGLELQGEDNSVLYAVGYNVNDKDGNSKKKKNNIYEDDDDDDDGVYFVDDWSSSTASTISTANNVPSGWETIERLVHTIQNELESSYGFDTCWPLDDPQGSEIVYDVEEVASAVQQQQQQQQQQKWRPRVPFVRLPSGFYQDLEKDILNRGGNNNNDGEGGNGDNEEDAGPLSKGLDGISPLFWYDAWGEEEILPTPGVRMSSVAIYRRMIPGGGEAESSFYVPTVNNDKPQPWNIMGGGESTSGTTSSKSMDLPDGDPKTMARERRERAKEMERLGDVESRAEREWEEGKARWMEQDRLGVAGADGDNTSSLWEEDAMMEMDIGIEVGEVTVEGDAAYSSPWSEREVVDTTSSDVTSEPKESPSMYQNSVLRELSKTDTSLPTSTPSSTASTLSQKEDKKPRRKRELPSIEDNPVFQRLREGKRQLTAKGQSTAQSLDNSSKLAAPSDIPLPPYPSDEHFVGIWRVVSSPLGMESIPSEESFSSTSSSAPSSSSDNLILRVDGTTMGGPILDAQFQHKAAGGTWKMFQAVRKSSGDNNKDDAPLMKQIRMRVRLLVPPEKERALVMEGEVTRMKFPGADDASSSSSELDSSDGWMMGSGGMLDGMTTDFLNVVEETTSSKRSSGEVLMYCGGEAWTEDADGGGNRKKLGAFSLMKLKTPDRDKLIYTVPASRI